MFTASTASLLDALRQHRLLDDKQLQELSRQHFSEPKSLAKELIHWGWLTPYQANQLLNGKGQELVLGSYILMERLGEGGMGQVFKARHRNLNRICALKLIRKERLDNPTAIRRFHREVQAAAALSHPNIVRAYDADEIAGTCLMAMEYLEGAVDLAKLVKKDGPLPVPQACVYIGQAALGLQHAYERGMVHRDIKPANLLLTDHGKVVKVLDMGLARLDHPADEEDGRSAMTLEGAVMGTPDYIAPEQALDTHRVDIRADLYSLGCTFYYLLTGQVPFPGGAMLHKLTRHQIEEPLPVEQLRPEVTPAIARIVRKLMAKKPADRYQAPAEVAAALAACDQEGGVACSFASEAPSVTDTAALTIDGKGRAEAVQEVKRDTLDSAYSYMELRDATPQDPLIRLDRTEGKQRRRQWYGIAGASLLCLAVPLGLYFFLAGKAADPPREGVVLDPFDIKKPVPKKVEDPLQPARALLGGKWHYIGPFDNPQMKGFDTVYPPEKEIDLKALYPGKNGVWVGWKEYPGFQLNVNLSLLPLFAHAAEKEWAVIYLYHEIEVTKPTSMPISLGSDDTLTVWLNGVRLVNKKVNRPVQPDGDFALLALQPGKNQLLVKICQTTGEWGFYISPVLETEVPFYMRNGFTAWLRKVGPQPGEKLLEAVTAKLQELNPGWDGKATHKKIVDGVVTELGFSSMSVTDISPLQALSGLKVLSCAGAAWNNRGSLANLTPLKELKLTSLNCDNTLVTDLAPLKDMPLTKLSCYATNVTYLAPLKDMLLTSLNCGGTKVADLGPLKDLKLTSLACNYTHIADLGPLKDMPLTSLSCNHTKVSDLAPLKDLPLTYLDCGNTLVSDLTPLTGLPLTTLSCAETKVTDLSRLTGLRLTYLNCATTSVADLSPLSEMPLTKVYFWGTQVSDITPLEGMKLREVGLTPKNVIKGIELLRQMKSVTSIWNGLDVKNRWPANEFWKKFDAGEFNP